MSSSVVKISYQLLPSFLLSWFLWVNVLLISLEGFWKGRKDKSVANPLCQTDVPSSLYLISHSLCHMPLIIFPLSYAPVYGQ
jgi:hypothetical protein